MSKDSSAKYYQNNKVRLKYQKKCKFFSLRVKKFYISKYKKFFQRGFFLFFELGKFLS